MLPHTHFLFALMLGMLAWRSGVMSWELALVAGIVATLIDLDHVYAYHKKHGDWSVEGAWRRAVSYHENEHTLVHRPLGFIAVTVILVVLGLFNPLFTLTGGLAYYSHYFLDMGHVSYEKRIREGKIVIPLSSLEITLDVICISVIAISAL